MISWKIFILAVCLRFTLVSGKDCVPTTLNELDTDCHTISGKTLTIQNVEDKKELKETLKNVRTIKEGVLVIDTDWEVFDLLENVDNIYNSKGPALVFSQNKRLKRIKLNSLANLRGKGHAVEFVNDNFPSAAYESSESLSDLREMEKAANRANSKPVCSPDFMKIVKPETEESDPFTIVFLVFAVIFAIVDVALAALLIRQYTKNKSGGEKTKKKKNKKEDKKGKKDGKKKETQKDK
uniref:Recep_L_domain domain-containing protein n=1 Tax=Caenorhabditis japonica TaxID=281687 RepID=A0A8R1HR22_CAEJA